ncbi:MAG TPA: beta-ketoacyl synthase N-terminal-like domain-containing protein [Burkholderiaceae bacterium]|nr:beta-ketoacyl synthase N-terminal-like domain-containing protein [Burkholderiaceae bacterium]
MLRPHRITYSTTCSSSAIAIGEAMRSIRSGYANVAIAGGGRKLADFCHGFCLAAAASVG